MANVTGSVKLVTATTQTPSGLPGNSVSGASVQQSPGFTFGTSGTAADQVDTKYTASLTLTASTPQTLNLQALIDIYGNAISFKRVKTLTVTMGSTTDGQTVTLSPGASNPWTGLFGTSTSTLVLQASTSSNQGFLALTAPNATGWAVSSTSNTLKLDPGSNTQTIGIEITGASA